MGCGAGPVGKPGDGPNHMRGLVSSRLGSHLRKLREERKLTLGAVERLTAEHAERINKTYLFRVESGKTLPTLPRLHALARVYRVRLPKLLEVLEGALEEIDQTAGARPEDPEGTFEELRSRGLEIEKGGEFLRATLHYRAALELALGSPASAERTARIATVRHDLSIALKNMGKLGLAQEEAEAAAELPALDRGLRDRINLNLADVYRRNRRREMARILLNDLLGRAGQLSPEVLSGSHSLMGSLVLPEDPREAARHYRIALETEKPLKNPMSEAMLLVNIGFAETNAGNFKRALRSFERALDLAKRKDFNFLSAKARSEIGRCLFLSGDHKTARSALREANRFARDREYYEIMFINGFYLRRIAQEENDLAEVKAIEASLRFFLTRTDATADEVEAFKREVAESEESTP